MLFHFYVYDIVTTDFVFQLMQLITKCVFFFRSAKSILEFVNAI